MEDWRGKERTLTTTHISPGLRMCMDQRRLRSATPLVLLRLFIFQKNFPMSYHDYQSPHTLLLCAPVRFDLPFKHVVNSWSYHIYISENVFFVFPRCHRLDTIYLALLLSLSPCHDHHSIPRDGPSRCSYLNATVGCDVKMASNYDFFYWGHHLWYRKFFGVPEIYGALCWYNRRDARAQCQSWFWCQSLTFDERE